jgi:hypothetical protein
MEKYSVIKFNSIKSIFHKKITQQLSAESSKKKYSTVHQDAKKKGRTEKKRKTTINYNYT